MWGRRVKESELFMGDLRRRVPLRGDRYAGAEVFGGVDMGIRKKLEVI